MKILREELINADLNLEKIKQKSAETNLQNQEILTSERRRRLEAEEDMKLHLEVNHFLYFEKFTSLSYLINKSKGLKIQMLF